MSTVMPTRHVLVPTDFSEAAEAGVATAARLLAQLGGRATLVHVVSLPILHPGDGELTQGHGEHAELEAAVHAHLDRIRAEAFEEIDDVKTALVRSDNPAEAIVELAAELDASMIVMSSQGRSGIERFLLGSVTERVVRHARCPVWVAR